MINLRYKGKLFTGQFFKRKLKGSPVSYKENLYFLSTVNPEMRMSQNRFVFHELSPSKENQYYSFKHCKKHKNVDDFHLMS
jgi:hypothetical protein